MLEESTEATIPPEQYNKKLINLLVGIAITLAVLMIGLAFAALVFLIYGLITAEFVVSIIGVVACVLGFGLLSGLFYMVIKILQRKTHGRLGNFPAALATGRETYAKVKEEKNKRYGRAKTGED